MADGLEALLRACTVRVLGGSAPGAGFFVAPGRILTCAHVIGESDHLTVRWERDGREPTEVPVTGPAVILPSRGRPIPALAADYPDVAVLAIGGLGDHPCVLLDDGSPGIEDGFQVYGYPSEGDAVLLTPARLTYRGQHGTTPAMFLDLGSDKIKPGMSGAALLNLRTGAVCGVLVASKNPASPDGALAVPWTEISLELSEVADANRSFHDADRRWTQARLLTASREPGFASPPDAATNGQPASTTTPDTWRSYFAQPAPVFRHFFGRDRERADLSSWLTSGNRMYVLHGPAGIGKSAFVLDWLERGEARENGFKGVFYWAFDQQNSFHGFMASLSEYLELDSNTGNPGPGGWTDMPLELAKALSERRVLLVLDGFEQQLVAYDDFMGRVKRDSQPVETSEQLRGVVVREAGRFLRLICAPTCLSKTIVVSRMVPYELSGDLGPVDGCVVFGMAGLNAPAAGQLLSHFAGRLRPGELFDIVNWADGHPQLLRLIGGMIKRGRLPSADPMGATASTVVWTHPEGPRDAIESLLQRLPTGQQALLAVSSAFGRRLSNVDLILLERARKEVQDGEVTSADCISQIRELLIPVVPAELYAYDSGGTQRNVGYETERQQRNDQALGMPSKFDLMASADVIRDELAALVDLGLVDRTSEGFSIHLVLQLGALGGLDQPQLTHLIFARLLAQRYATRRPRGDDRVELLIAVFTHLVHARQFQAAADLLFSRLIEPLFFGSARFHDLRILARAILPSNWQQTAPPRPEVHAHMLAFYARILSKTGDSANAVRTWQEHRKLRSTMGDDANVAAGLGYLSQDQSLLGDLPGAISSLDDALQITRELATIGQRDGSQVIVIQHAMHLTFLANVLSSAGDFRRAHQTNREALQLWRRFNPHYVGIANCAINDGELAAWRGDFRAVTRAAKTALKQSDLGGYHRGNILGLRLLAIGMRLAGDATGALAHLEEALAGCRATQYVEVEPDLLIQIGSCHLDAGDIIRASDAAAEALDLARSLRYRPNVADANLLNARILVGSSHDAAKEWCAEALHAAFGTGWENFVVGDRWKSTWWEACRSDREVVGIGVVDEDWWWKSGYKPVMDNALELWFQLTKSLG